MKQKVLSPADLQPIQGLDPNDPLGFIPPRPRGKVHDIHDIHKATIKRSVKRQAHSLRWYNRLRTRVRTAVAVWMYDTKVRLGIVEPQILKEDRSVIADSCPCTCLLGERHGEKDPHFTETLGGYEYRFCKTCIKKVGWRYRKNYYFCATTASIEHTRNVAAAIRAGEIETYRTCEEEGVAEARAEAERIQLSLNGADDQAQESGGNVPSAQLLNAGAVGADVAEAASGGGVRHQAQSDPHVSDGGDGARAGVSPVMPTAVCPGCGEQYFGSPQEVLNKFKEHTCL